MRILLLLCFSALLGACFPLGQRSEGGMRLLDFGTPPSPLQEAAGRPVNALVEVGKPQWQDGLGIRYRLSYQDASQVREYARSRWAGPPARLVEQRLRQRLDLSSAGQRRGQCVLRIELDEFSQVFASPNDSIGLLQGQAFWLDPARRPLAERRLSISSPAEAANASGGVAALQAAVDQLAGELLAWESELAAGGQIRACRE